MDKRRELIEDCVKIYIKNNPAEYETQVALNKQRRNRLFDTQFGQIKKGAKIDKDGFRVAFSIPSRLMGTIDTLLKDSEKFLDDSKESAWFAKRYPEFLIPNRY